MRIKVAILSEITCALQSDQAGCDGNLLLDTKLSWQNQRRIYVKANLVTLRDLVAWSTGANKEKSPGGESQLNLVK